MHRYKHQAPPAPPVGHEVWGPEDFWKFHTDLPGPPEHQSIANWTMDSPRSPPKVFKTDHKVEYKPYPGATASKQTPKPYVPPALLAGYVNGVPPILRARHNNSTTNLASQHQQGGPHSTDTRSYAYPLVDFHQGLFLNANMVESHIPSSRYAQPRIPTPEFSTIGVGHLEAEVSAELRRRRVPMATASRPQSRAWMSPGCPLPQEEYNIEASSTTLPSLNRNPRTMTRKSGRVFHAPTSNNGPVSVGAEAQDAGQVKYNEYNWPRFSDSNFEDPAAEYSRRCRQQRRRGGFQVEEAVME